MDAAAAAEDNPLDEVDDAFPLDVVDKMIDAPLQELEDEEVYYMGYKEKSVALLFNNFEFDSKGLISNRARAESDGIKLASSLEKLNFDVRCHLNLSLNGIKKEVEAVANENHRERDCLFVIILTKGEDGSLYAKDLKYSDQMIWEAFEANKAPSLIGKPKVFILQSEEGSSLEHAVSLQVLSAKRTKYPVRLIPKSADIFIFHAPSKEGVQTSMSEHGNSLFVQEFCSRLEKYASKEDLVRIMMHVTRKLSKRLSSTCMGCMPVYTSTLTKLLYLCKQTY